MPFLEGTGPARSARDRIDPEVRVGIEGYFDAVGVGGLGAIADLGERRGALARLMAAGVVPRNPAVEREDRMVPGLDGAPDVRLRIYRPAAGAAVLPAVFFIHGGGLTMGSIETEEAIAEGLCFQSGYVTVSVDYRLAPEDPFPAQVEDCHAGLRWTIENASEIGIFPERVAIYGGSAGGGLAAATALRARDLGGPVPAFQMLIYPMLDDRSESSSSHEILDIGVWDRAANIEAWNYLLGDLDRAAVPPYAAPARAADLAGLPPTYIDVGGLDLFRDESIEYARRLMAAGVDTELHVYPGVVHSSEVFAPEASVSKDMVETRILALRRALETASRRPGSVPSDPRGACGDG